MSSALKNLITDFVEYCEVDRGLSSRTAEKYDYRLQRFLIWAQTQLRKKNLELSDLSLDLVRKFRLFLNRQELKESTQYNYLVTIRSFLKFLSKQDFNTIPPEKVELAKYSPSRSIKFLAADQLELLLKAPDTSSLKGIRDRAILEVLFSTGLRVSELAALNRDQIDLKRGEFDVVGKGKHRRVVFLSKTAAEWLQKYLDRRVDQYLPLLLHYSGPMSYTGSKNNENNLVGSKHISALDNLDLEDPDGERFRLSVRSIQRIVKKYVKQAGVKIDATPHTLRHSLATDLLGAGADLRSIQEILGHKNVATTQIYTHVTNVQLKQTHQKFHRRWR